MAKSLGLEAYWTKFVQSPDFKTLSNYPTEVVRQVVQQLDMLMKQSDLEYPSEWDEDVIWSLLTSFVEQADSNGSPEANSTLITFYDIFRALVRFLAVNDALGMSQQQLSYLLEQFESENGLGGELGEIPPEDKYYVPGLPEWRQYISDDINRYTTIWVRKYSNSSDWKYRTKGVTKKLLSGVMIELTNYIYNNYRKTPKTWTKTALKGVMTTAFVENMDFTEKEYSLISPAVSGLMDYVASKGWLNPTRASNYKRYLAAVAPEMIELAKDPRNFGNAKLLSFKMKERGIDLNDEEAVEKFFIEVEDNGGINSLLGKESENDKINSDIETALKLPEALELVAQLYDPDREQEYLADPHQSKNGNKRWSGKNAIEVHTQAVQDAVLLWGNRDKYDIKMFGRAEVVIQNVADLMDAIYAQNVEIPKQWSTQTFDILGKWSRDTHTPGFYANTVKLLTGLLDVIADNGSFSEEHAAALLKAYRGNVIPFNRKK